MTMFPRPFAAVNLDLDGTLVHSAPDISAAMNIILREEGLLPFAVEESLRFVGEGAARLIDSAFAARDVTLTPERATALTARYLRTYATRGSPDTTLYPGAREMLAELQARRIPVAVCTNKAENISRDVVAQFGLDRWLGAVIGSDSGFGRKPTAGPLREACRRLGVDPTATLMVGDTGTDVGTARATPCACAVVRNGYSQSPVETLGADILIASVADVPQLIAA
jgi:phosphoglycolate phosphatase